MSKRKIYSYCTNCGKEFEVSKPSEADPNNKRKFKRACSRECTSELKSKNMKQLHSNGKLTYERPKLVTKLEREDLIQMYCYEYLLLNDIAKKLGVKYQTLQREFERLEIPKEFYRKCPHCNEWFSCKIRSQTNPNSNKFKKYCSRKCFLSSRSQTGTWIEVEIASFFDEKGIDYIDQFEIDRMTVDFCIPDKDLLIEANGDFWHANPDIYGKEKPLHKIHRRVIAKDERKQRQLEEKGYKLIVIWENDLATNKEETLNSLYEIIKGA